MKKLIIILPLLYYSCTSEKVDTDEASKSDKMFKLLKNVAKDVKIHLNIWIGIIKPKVRELSHYLINVLKNVMPVLVILLNRNN